MKWEPKSGVLVFSIKLDKHTYTRRGILATYYQIFDLNGIVQSL